MTDNKSAPEAAPADAAAPTQTPRKSPPAAPKVTATYVPDPTPVAEELPEARH
jgi:hypothetical protein